MRVARQVLGGHPTLQGCRVVAVVEEESRGQETRWGGAPRVGETLGAFRKGCRWRGGVRLCIRVSECGCRVFRKG